MKKRIVSLDIDVGSYETIFKQIISLSSEQSSSYVCVSNVHMTIEAYQDVAFAQMVNQADMAVADGMPLAKAMKLLYGIKQDRVAGMDLMPDLIQECAKLEKKVFLYGSTSDILEKIENKAKQEYPSVKIKSYSPPFRILSTEEKNNIIQMINEYNPDFVFVALGCPKQEKWMAEHKDKIHSCMIGLGGALEVYAGVKDRAPKWMQNNSLEWLYRLIQDPKRLWKRYLVTNSMFVYLLFKQYLKQKILKNND